jgi:uncharacterized membrane protein YdjX (TVP38/TMEM64 family)
MNKFQHMKLVALMVFATAGPGIGIVVLTASHEIWWPSLSAMGNNALPLFYILGTLLAALSLVPTHAVSLIAGMAFGAGLGSVMAIVSINSAALCAYTVVRWILANQLTQSLSEHPKTKHFVQTLLNRSPQQRFGLLTCIRLSPLMPFALTNVVLGAFEIKTKDFLICSILGLAPRIIVVVMAGSQLQKLDLSVANDRWMLGLGALATVVSLFIMGRAAKKVIAS